MSSTSTRPQMRCADTWYFHVVASELYTYLFASHTRAKTAPDAAGVLPDFRGTMVHDRLSMYWSSAPRGAMAYPPRSGEGLEVTSLGSMAHLG
ncbi:MAG: hypothetical protein ACYDEY_16030 [Acidimicrobiales bacterium]